MGGGTKWIWEGLARLSRSRLRMSGRQYGPGVGLLRIDGRLSRAGLRAFWRHASRRLAWGEHTLLVDLRACTELTASGAVACLVLSMDCRRAGGGVVLITASGEPPPVFECIGAVRAVNAAPSVESALALRRLDGRWSEPA